MTINVHKTSCVAATSIFRFAFILNINYHQCPLIYPLILASRFCLNINVHECPLIISLILFFALGRRKIVPNILMNFALACLWGRGFGGINLGVCVVSCKFGKDLVEGFDG